MTRLTAEAWLDFRSDQDYQQGHLPNAAHFEWPNLTEQLNQLPAPPSALGLIAPENQLNEIQAFLQSKAYQIVETIPSDQFNVTQPGLVMGKSPQLWSPTPILQTFVQNEITRPGLALDLGCGGGRDAVFLAEQGWQVTAIDNQARVLERAQSLAESRRVSVNWLEADLRQPQARPEPFFDLVLMVRFLNRDLFPYIKHITRPGGYVLIHTFSQGSEQFGSPKNPNLILKPGELAKEFVEFDIIIDKIEPLEDGRPMATFVARKRRIHEEDNL
mgnify:CR=1 FL=1